MGNFWDKRYNSDVFVYGEAPNLFFKEQLDRLPPGKILLPAEGEGRNAVYAARNKWTVSAFDGSSVAKEKALKYANLHQVSIDYKAIDFEEATYQLNEFDVIGLTYAHVRADKKLAYYQNLIPYLKPGGTVIFEGFSLKHQEQQAVNPNAGGPRDSAMLFTSEDIHTIFKQFDTLLLEELELDLDEGFGHQGTSSVLRYVGKKRA